MGDINRMRARIYENPPEDINPEVENRRSSLMEEMMLLASVIHYIHKEGPRDPNNHNEEDRRKNQWKSKADEFISLGSQADSSDVVLSPEFEESLKRELDNLILISIDRLKEIRNILLNMVNVQISSIDFFDDEEIDSKIAATERLSNLFFMYERVTEEIQGRSVAGENPEKKLHFSTLKELKSRRSRLIEDIIILQTSINEINARRDSPYEGDELELKKIREHWISKNEEVLDIDRKINDIEKSSGGGLN